MLLFHSVKHQSHLVSQRIRSIRTRLPLKLYLLNVSVQCCFLFWYFTERFDSSHKLLMYLLCDRFFSCDAQHVAVENVQQNCLRFIIQRVSRCKFVSTVLSRRKVQRLSSQDTAYRTCRYVFSRKASLLLLKLDYLVKRISEKLFDR